MAVTYPRTSARERLRGWRPQIRHAVPRPGEMLPPGPSGPAALQSLRTWASRNTYWPALQRRYGDTFSLHVAPIGPIVVACGAQDVRRIALGGPDTFPVGENNTLFAPILGARTVLALDGQAHRSERRRMTPPFHGERIAGVMSTMERLAAREVATWPVGRTFPLVPRMRKLTLRVIIQAVMGVTDPDRTEKFVTALRPLVDLGTLDLLMWVWPGLARVGPWRRTIEGVDYADELLYEEIERARRDPDRRQRPDVLAMLLDGDPDDELVRIELVTLLTGGHETTAQASAWMFERLLRHPQALARVRAGLDEPDDEYRTAVVKETLRLRPLSYNLGRRITEPVEVGGYRLPAGTFVWPSIGAVHTDRRVWGGDADEFRPERWLEPDPPVHAFLPFGGGAHRCIGAQFAQTEMEIILRTVLRHVELAPDRQAGEAAGMRSIILVPKRGGRVRVVA